MAAFNVRGGPHPGADHANAATDLQAAARLLGARNLHHDSDENAYTLTIDAPTVTTAFQTVTDLFRRVYGDGWWAEVAVIPYYN